MADFIQDLRLRALPRLADSGVADPKRIQATYDANRHRIYALAFWLTDHEIAAEEVMSSVFRRAFSYTDQPAPELLDRVLVKELRELMPVGVITLNCSTSTEIRNVRSNTLRTHLERAVVGLPPTERLIFVFHDVERYTHDRIARTLGISEEESRTGLHQARLRIRELLAGM